MAVKGNNEIVHGLMDAVIQSEEWTKVVTESPYIAETEKEVEEEIKKLCQGRSLVETDELRSAILQYVNAHIDAAMLFGMRIMDVLKIAANDPVDYGKYVQAKVGTR